MHARPTARLREAACLAHIVPGITLRLRAVAGGHSLLVSRHCLGADLDPCQLRAAMLARTGEHLAGTIAAVELIAGLVHLGGGIYARAGAGGVDERWFLTHLPYATVVEVLAACPEQDDGRVEAVVKPDPELGLCAVRVTGGGQALDALAMWALTACLVEELLVDVATAPLR